MMKDEIKTLYQTYIKNPNVPVVLKSQVSLHLLKFQFKKLIYNNLRRYS